MNPKLAAQHFLPKCSKHSATQAAGRRFLLQTTLVTTIFYLETVWRVLAKILELGRRVRDREYKMGQFDVPHEVRQGCNKQSLTVTVFSEQLAVLIDTDEQG